MFAHLKSAYSYAGWYLRSWQFMQLKEIKILSIFVILHTLNLKNCRSLSLVSKGFVNITILVAMNRLKFFWSTVGMIGVITIALMYVLYIRILCKYWRLKRRNSRERKKSDGSGITPNPESIYGSKFQPICKSSKGDPVLLKVKNLETNRVIQKRHTSPRKRSTLKKIHIFAQNAKYVVVILAAFTLCWIPWIFTYFGDILFHASGLFHQRIQESCGSSNYMEIQGTSQTLLCIHGLIINDQIPNPNCQTQNNDSLCLETIFHTHNFLLSNFAELSIIIAMSNSLINPFIYLMCSTEFRTAVRYFVKKLEMIIKKRSIY